MTWSVTLQITDCATGSAIGGVWVSDGTNSYPADAFGRFIAVVYDDDFEGWGFQLSHTSYVTTYFDAVKSTMAGTTQPVCMNAAPAVTPTPVGPPGTFTGW
jgi:hypothetical protein